ncbi:hypothetical protein N658DRAFT_493685 [Parathielavia hyrcaniae]|uniref:AAA+ ATPase domain-containing protein n=1 Tax=Parathielavia hyrcaniae TaxID=113614 RepID=A0AAN6T4X9_9PEZI|nr:hypothetical protein N658DRAFT_493685 [Parathielavia hyrcaniae]
MSLADYQKAIPGVFKASASPTAATSGRTPVNGPGAEGPGNEDVQQSSNRDAQDKSAADTETQPTQSKKGFIDIIEFHKKNSDGGYDQQIIPTSRYLPKRAKHSTKTRKYEDHVLVLRRTVLQQREGATVLRVELEIQSRRLCKALRRIMRNCYEGTNLQTFPIKLAGPFAELFFYRNDIRDLAESGDVSSELRQDAKLLHDFILNNGLLKSILHDHERYTKKKQVAGDIVWTIYPPNHLAVLNVDGVQECWVVRNVLQLPTESGYVWEVTGLRVGCDGKQPGFFRQKCVVAAVTLGLHNITELPLIPVDQLPDWKRVKDVLAKRYSKLERTLGISLTSFKPQVYKGDAWETNMAGASYAPSKTPLREEKQMDERVVVDYTAFRESGSRRTHQQVGEPEDLYIQTKRRKGQPVVRARGVVAKTAAGSSDDSDDSDDSSDSDRDDFEDSDDDADANQLVGKGRRSKKADIEVNEFVEFKPIEATMGEVDDNTTRHTRTSSTTLDDLAQDAEQVLHISRDDFNLLFPALVPAFGLKSKDWRWVMADGLQDVVWNSTAFESLQYDEGTKNLVRALIRGHKRGLRTGFDDLIAGKGQGLVFLLHGEPGLGKTLTAESIADYLERPLYSISGGEVGTDVSSVEVRLSQIFELTKRWDAVSLLDEADVLLCKRSSAEMQRNAIVGVFLRKLEYFQGVLFLTTNRKDDFDEAFKSRIHVTISYPPLSNEAQSTIWQRLIENSKNVKLDGAWDGQVYTALGRLNLNGRTIKNILRTAVAYAYADGNALGLWHVVAMLKAEFHEIVEAEAVAVDDENLTEAERVKRADVLGGLAELRRLVQRDEKRSISSP